MALAVDRVGFTSVVPTPGPEGRAVSASEAPQGPPPPTPADRVRAAVADGRSPDKRDLENALCEIGLSKRQAKKLLARGWCGIATNEPDEILELVEEISRKLRS